MNKKIKPTVYSILLEDEYARSNDNYLIVRVIQKLEPLLAKGKLTDLRFSKLSLEGITRVRRDFFKTYPELEPEEATKSRRKEEQEYFLEYSGNHIPRID